MKSVGARTAALLFFALLAAPASAQTPGPPAPLGLSLLGADGEKVTLTAVELSHLPRTQAVLEHAGRRVRFAGPRLFDVLRLVGAPLGAELRGPALALVVIAQGRDGYRTALGLGDADPAIRAEPVIVADQADGAPLGEDGPIRLIVGGDLRPARSVRNLVSLEVRRLSPP